MSYTKGQLRTWVRETVAAADGFWFTEAMIEDSVSLRTPQDVDLSDLRHAIEWNHGKRYLQSRQNDETEEREYKLTKEGRAREERG